MRNSLLLVVFMGMIAGACTIVTEDKPVNSAPPTSTAPATPTATTTPTAKPRLRKAPPPPAFDGGF
ncbi:MAG TPA: hypothetical protein VI072_07935 [Polyangiaceae bacterium]